MGAAAAAKARSDVDQQRVIDITLATYARLLRDRGLQRLAAKVTIDEVVLRIEDQ
jgi:hypothetical protein